MTPELALLIAKARHRYVEEPLDEKAVADARRLDEFRQYLAANLDIAVRLELIFQGHFFVNENGKATVRFSIDENEFVLTRTENSCELTVQGTAVELDQNQFEDHLLWAIGEITRTK